MNFEITGQVVSIGSLQSRQWQDKTFTNRSIIISVASGNEGQYLKHAEFNVAEAQFDHLDRNKPGDTVLIKFSLDGGKPYTSNKTGEPSVFNKLRAFYISNESQANPAAPQAQAAPASTKAEQPVMPPMPSEDDGNIPF
jgi:hypothetical protein